MDSGRSHLRILQDQQGNETEADGDEAYEAQLTVGEPRADRQAGLITVPVQGDTSVLVDAVRLLDTAQVSITDLSLHRPSLDDVFLAITGRGAEEAAEEVGAA